LLSRSTLLADEIDDWSRVFIDSQAALAAVVIPVLEEPTPDEAIMDFAGHRVELEQHASAAVTAPHTLTT
jgi:hypothetical protein